MAMWHWQAIEKTVDAIDWLGGWAAHCRQLQICILNVLITYRLRLHLAHFQAALLRVKVQVTLWQRGTDDKITVRQAPVVHTMYGRTPGEDAPATTLLSHCLIPS